MDKHKLQNGPRSQPAYTHKKPAMSSNPTAVPAATFDVTKIKFSDVATNSRGSPSVYINADGGPIYLQAPYMHCPFGVNVNKNEGKTSYSVSLSFKGEEGDEQIRKTHEMLLALDKLVTDTALSEKNREAWFGAKNGKAKSEEVILENYNPIVKPDKSGKWPDSFKVGINLDRDGVPDLKVWTEFNKQVDPASLEDTLPRQSYVQPVFKVVQVYFIGKAMWGVSLKLFALRFKAVATKPVDFEHFFPGEEPPPAAGVNPDDEVEYEEVEEEVDESDDEDAPPAKKSA